MKLSTIIAATLLVVSPALSLAQASSPPTSSNFESTGEDRAAIETLLETYAHAVSTKNQALFETILLNKEIPFSDVYSATKSNGAVGSTSNYDRFRRGVFSGEPFTQKFQNVHIAQDGLLADVSVVFVNKTADETSWGWKTLQLLKVGGHWKIASEFYTGHD
jgi:hypothetical protein